MSHQVAHCHPELVVGFSAGHMSAKMPGIFRSQEHIPLVTLNNRFLTDGNGDFQPFFHGKGLLHHSIETTIKNDCLGY